MSYLDQLLESLKKNQESRAATLVIKKTYNEKLIKLDDTLVELKEIELMLLNQIEKEKHKLGLA